MNPDGTWWYKWINEKLQILQVWKLWKSLAMTNMLRRESYFHKEHFLPNTVDKLAKGCPV